MWSGYDFVIRAGIWNITSISFQHRYDQFWLIQSIQSLVRYEQFMIIYESYIALVEHLLIDEEIIAYN